MSRSNEDGNDRLEVLELEIHHEDCNQEDEEEEIEKTKLLSLPIMSSSPKSQQQQQQQESHLEKKETAVNQAARNRLLFILGLLFTAFLARTMVNQSSLGNNRGSSNSTNTGNSTNTNDDNENHNHLSTVKEAPTNTTQTETTTTTTTMPKRNQNETIEFYKGDGKSERLQHHGEDGKDIDQIILESRFPHRPLSDRVKRQILNYRQTKGILVNIHITHHAGTEFCKYIGKNPSAIGTAPSFACMGIKRETPQNAHIPEDYPYPKDRPWTGNETDHNIDVVRQYFHMVSWEFKAPNKTPLNSTEWENPKLLSVIVMRDPMSRMLAGDAYVSGQFPGLLRGNATHDMWWEFARDNSTRTKTDNYALRILADRGCCQGEDTDRKHLEHAQETMERMSIVLDLACLNEGMETLADLLNLTLPSSQLRKPKPHASVYERIGHDDVYQHLLKRNKLDIELYEWSKTIALVNCTDPAVVAGKNRRRRQQKRQLKRQRLSAKPHSRYFGCV